MEIYPAVDLYEGKVVRLERGDYSRLSVYSDKPAQIAQQWIQAGARWLHVVDLEGARSGEIRNWAALEQILELKKGSVQFGGGVRLPEDIDRLIKAGIQRVILGSRALDPFFLKEVTEAYPRKIAVSLDVRGEEVQIEGWTKGGGKSVTDLFNEMKSYPLDCMIVTDIERDGTLSGIHLEKIERLLKNATFPIILSGGVGSLEDLRSLKTLRSDRLKGVIIGKALYEKKVDLRQALNLIQGKEN